MSVCLSLVLRILCVVRTSAPKAWHQGGILSPRVPPGSGVEPRSQKRSDEVRIHCCSVRSTQARLSCGAHPLSTLAGCSTRTPCTAHAASSSVCSTAQRQALEPSSWHPTRGLHTPIAPGALQSQHNGNCIGPACCCMLILLAAAPSVVTHAIQFRRSTRPRKGRHRPT